MPVALPVWQVAYLLAFGIGMSPIPWTINAEIYPMKVRTACVAIGTGCNWVSNFIVAATFLSLTEVSRPGAFWLYGGVALLGGAWLYASMPETAGCSLEQIEKLFVDGRQDGTLQAQVGSVQGRGGDRTRTTTTTSASREPDVI